MNLLKPPKALYFRLFIKTCLDLTSPRCCILIIGLIFSPLFIYANNSNCTSSASETSQVKADSVDKGLVALSKAYDKIKANSSLDTQVVEQFYIGVSKFFQLHQDVFNSPNDVIKAIKKKTNPSTKLEAKNVEPLIRENILKNARGRFIEKAELVDSEEKVIWESPSKNWRISSRNPKGLGLNRFRIRYKDLKTDVKEDGLDVNKIQEWNGNLLISDKNSIELYSMNAPGRKSQYSKFRLNNIIDLSKDKIVFLDGDSIKSVSMVNGLLEFSYPSFKKIRSPQLYKISENKFIINSQADPFNGFPKANFYELNRNLEVKERDDLIEKLDSSNDIEAFLAKDEKLEIHFKHESKSSVEILEVENLREDSMVFRVDDNNLLITFNFPEMKEAVSNGPKNEDSTQAYTLWYRKNSEGNFVQQSSFPYFNLFRKVDTMLFGMNREQQWFQINLEKNLTVTDLNMNGALEYHAPYILFTNNMKLSIYKNTEDGKSLELVKEVEGGHFQPKLNLLIENQYLLNFSFVKSLLVIDLSQKEPETNSYNYPQNASYTSLQPVADTANSIFLGFGTGMNRGSLLVIDFTRENPLFHRLETDFPMSPDFFQYLNKNKAFMGEKGIYIGKDVLIPIIRDDHDFK